MITNVVTRMLMLINESMHLRNTCENFIHSTLMFVVNISHKMNTKQA